MQNVGKVLVDPYSRMRFGKIEHVRRHWRRNKWRWAIRRHAENQ